MPSNNGGKRIAQNAAIARASLSGLALGIVLLIAGVALHAHFGPLDALCSSGVGVLAQEVDQSIQGQCGVATFLDALGQAGIGMGIFALIGGGLAGLIFLMNGGVDSLRVELAGGAPSRPTVPKPSPTKLAVSSTSAQSPAVGPPSLRPSAPRSADPPDLGTPAIPPPPTDRDSSQSDRMRERLWGDRGDR
jgi:hypothetical protein